jgi:ABC-type phosphate transport system substrate-binding protein
MIKAIISLLALLCITAANSVAASDKIVVIVNESNTQTLTAADLKNMYSDIVIHWSNHQPIDMYDTPVSARARQVFSEKILGISANDAAMAWANRKITNTAKNPPKTTKENLVPKYVAKDPNAIGYVSSSVAEGKPGIRIIMTLE